MSFRVVLYAEGVGELGGGIQPAPGDPIPDEALGPAHDLVRRCLEVERRIPEAATTFVAPLRLRARQARGSDLLSRESLRQLLSWPLKQRRPDLAVVLVDADGDSGRQKLLQDYVADLLISKVVGVAIQEFEAWLLADVSAVSSTLGRTLQTTAEPESLERRKAKGILNDWVAEHSQEKDKALQLRRQIARLSDLDLIGRRCRAFGDFRRALREVQTTG